MKSKIIFSLFLLLSGLTIKLLSQTTVTIDQRSDYYYASFFDGGGYFNQGSDEVGMWANSGSTNKRAVLWRKLKINGNNTGSDRSMQIGDKFTITVSARRAYGRIGCALLASPTVGSNWDNRESNYAISVNLDGPAYTGSFWGTWYLKYKDGATSSTTFGGDENTYYDYIFEFVLTAPGRMNVTISDSRPSPNSITFYDVELNTSNPITDYSIYLQDDWTNNSNANVYWKPITSMQNTGASAIGASNNTFSITNAITNGFEANSTSTSYPNALTKSGTGTITLTGANTYTGNTTVSNGTLQLNRPGGATLASTSTVSVNSGGTLQVSSNQTLGNLTIASGGGLMVDNGVTLTITGIADFFESASLDGSLVISGSGTLTVATGKNLTINGTLDLSPGQTIAGTLTIASGGNLILASSQTLTIDGSLALNESVILDGNLSIGSGGAATLAVNKGLTVSGTLSNSGTLTIKSDASGTGSLIHSSSGVSATVERYVAGHANVAADGWHLMGSPVATFNISGSPFAPGTSDDFYGWSESTNTWLNYKAGNPTQIVPGTGYLVAYENTGTKTFSGNLNVSDVSVSGLSYNPSQGNGWHLLGNPFASALEWNKTGGSWSLSNVAGTAKVWNSGTKAYDDVVANGIIPSAQGFFVQVNNATNGLTIPAAARAHSSTAWYKNTTPRILLSASPADGSSRQESQIRMEAEATAGFDFYHDSRFLPGYAPQFYSKAGAEMLSTNAMPQILSGTSIPFGFVKNQHNSFVIRLEESLPDETILLKDLKLNLTHNLSQQPEYLFSAAEGDDANRFLVVFGTVGINEKPNNQQTLQAAMHNGQLWVNNPTDSSLLSIHDLSGRLLQQLRLQNSGLQQLGTNLRPGAYLIRLQGNSQTLSTKVINR